MGDLMTTRGEAAIAEARREHDDGVTFPLGMCLQRVRLCYDVAALYTDAATAWLRARHRHPQVDPAAFPRGVPVFWTGGSAGHGHIAIATGDGECWSTDILRGGHWDKVPIDLIRQRWGLALVGWTEDLNGVTVYEPTLEEDMPLTPDEIDAIAKAVARYKLGNGGYVGWNVADTRERLVRVEAAVTALAAGISPAVEAAVKEALAAGVVDVDVTVHDKTGA
jgi:hypothetical protein